jgi:putative membrane protein
VGGEADPVSAVDQDEVSSMMWWGDRGFGAGGWVAMSMMMLLFWVVVIAAGVWLLRSRRSPRPVTGSERADAQLAERFARGEIDEAQFVRSRAILRGEHPL